MFFSTKNCTLKIVDNYLLDSLPTISLLKNSFPFFQFCFPSNLNLFYLARNVY